MTRLPDEEVTVKISCCNNCAGIVRAGVLHEMDLKARNEFMREVMKHNLSVKALSLLEYRASKLNWCKCDHS